MIFDKERFFQNSSLQKTLYLLIDLFDIPPHSQTTPFQKLHLTTKYSPVLTAKHVP